MIPKPVVAYLALIAVIIFAVMSIDTSPRLENVATGFLPSPERITNNY